MVGMCRGFALLQPLPGGTNLDQSKGEIYHVAEWPNSNIDWKDKRVAIMGTGASVAQVI